MATVKFVLNGRLTEVEVAETETLLSVLRNRLMLTGTKEGCGEGDCGACTVLLNNRAVNSCLVLAAEVEGQEVLTIEGVAQGNELDKIQQAFLDAGAVQCGYCTPGMVLATKALLHEIPKPSEAEIKSYISGNLCRCTGYQKIVQAIKLASE